MKEQLRSIMGAWAMAHVCVPVAAAQGPVPEPPPATPAPSMEVTQAPTVLLVETQTVGIDPVVGRVANRRIRATVASLGYTPLDAGRARESMERLGIGYPPSMANLWRITYNVRAERGVFAVVWASSGRYVAEVRVASRDGAGPFYARGESDASGLDAKLDALVREALPAPGVAAAPAAGPVTPAPVGGAGLPAAAEAPRTAVEAPGPVAAEAPPVTAEAPAAAVPAVEPAAEAAEAKAPPAAAPPVEERPRRRWRLAAQTESAFGLAEDPFYVHLVGARADLRFGQEFAFGAFAAYANLPGREGRVTSALTSLQLEQRIALGDDGPVALPLRVALGYLWRNGPVLRLGSGIAFDLGNGADLVIDLVTPTFWVTPERTLFSLDVAVEIGWTLR